MGGKAGLPHKASGTSLEVASEGFVTGMHAKMSLKVEAFGKLLCTLGKRAVIERLAVWIGRGDGALSGIGIGGV